MRRRHREELREQGNDYSGYEKAQMLERHARELAEAVTQDQASQKRELERKKDRASCADSMQVWLLSLGFTMEEIIELLEVE